MMQLASNSAQKLGFCGGIVTTRILKALRKDNNYVMYVMYLLASIYDTIIFF